MNKDQLLSLTLRQLRQEASKLSVPLYSRKTKAVLIDLILKYQEKSTKKTYITPSKPIPEETSESNAFNSSEEVKTNLVFLPRDPDWSRGLGDVYKRQVLSHQSLNPQYFCLFFLKKYLIFSQWILTARKKDH